MDEERTEGQPEEVQETQAATIADILTELRGLREELNAIAANTQKPERAPLPPKMDVGEKTPKRSIYDM